jgi:two-component system chemotaxis response regulator CheB
MINDNRRIRVLVVDDSAFSRQTIKGMLESDPDIEVVGIAINGVDAMAKTLKLKPDLITLDFEMPEMDGFSFLRWVMKEIPTPVIMVSSFSDSNTVFKALEMGAVDFIAKPVKRSSPELRMIEKDLLAKVKALRNFNMEKLSKSLELLNIDEDVAAIETQAHDVDVVAVGSSTGGPAALQIIITRLPHDFPAAVLVSQHMPKGFTGPLAERLNRLSEVHVKEAVDGDVVEHGKVFICPGGSHMTIREKGQRRYIHLKQGSPEDRYVPSVDIMMSSVAEHYGGNTVGVILTGMGNDGKKGILEIKAKGGYTIVESEETAVIFGMPAEVISTGAVDKILALPDMPEELVKIVKRGSS